MYRNSFPVGDAEYENDMLPDLGPDCKGEAASIKK
jgi:hypothetical protein